MATPLPLAGLTRWIVHRLVANWWSLAVGAVLAAPVAFAAVLHLDRSGGTDWLLDRDLATAAAAGSAQETASVMVGMNAAFITLYFSISLIVLTIAAGNLGVRLIDRWLERRLVRVSLAGLSFTLVYSLFTLAAIDPDADLADVPLLVLGTTMGLQMVNIAMLAVALHDLGRSMFVDRAIADISRDARKAALPVAAGKPFAASPQETVDAPREGYVQGLDLACLRRDLAAHPGGVRFCVAPGQYVLEGQPLVELERAGADLRALSRAIPIGRYRADGEGIVYRLRLLVEIAARALSPAVNDFYTALSAADRIAALLDAHLGLWVDDGMVAVDEQTPRFQLVGQDLRALVDAPLQAFRQAAADYPSVALRMGGHYADLAHRAGAQHLSAQVSAYLTGLARDLLTHARQQAGHDRDIADLTARLEGLERGA